MMRPQDQMKPENICAFESCVRDGKLREGVVGRSKLMLLDLRVGVQWRERLKVSVCPTGILRPLHQDSRRSLEMRV